VFNRRRKVGFIISNVVTFFPAGTLQLSVHNTIYNYMMILTSIPLGLAVASSTVVGNALGAGDALTARRAAIASFGVELTLALVYGVGTILARYKAPLVRCLFAVLFTVLNVASLCHFVLRFTRPILPWLMVLPFCCRTWLCSWSWMGGN
jgi:Na+-driven multidrug efflux pump